MSPVSLKLSEAIKLGAMLKPQAFGQAFVFVSFANLGSCALGAAEDAVFGPILESSDGGTRALEVYARYDAVLSLRRTCPACDLRRQVASIIPHLNDEHLWTREQIADWVATIEPQDSPVAVAVPVTAEAVKVIA